MRRKPTRCLGAIADATAAINIVWLLIAGTLVLFMQAGFALAEAARTGEVGDGKIFVALVARAIRIRTADTDEAAI